MQQAATCSTGGENTGRIALVDASRRATSSPACEHVNAVLMRGRWERLSTSPPTNISVDCRNVTQQPPERVEHHNLRAPKASAAADSFSSGVAPCPAVAAHVGGNINSSVTTMVAWPAAAATCDTLKAAGLHHSRTDHLQSLI